MGTLRHALCYPAKADVFSDDDLKSILDTVHLPELKAQLDESSNWSMSLSIGEQQRVAIARALLLKPDWLYLDEATSALDEENEQEMYQLLLQRLPQTTILSIAHRPGVARFHGNNLAIDPKTRRATIAPLPAE